MSPVDTTPSSVDQTTRRVVWWMAVTMLLSFSFGVAMFIPEEHRVQKLEETMAKYQARRSGP
ncbi:MAG: hypothetical protein QF921_03455 [Pseudomonadales bacterium]|jgi:hypothetical protein|nr:hypothetical protein [Pseudomonadales bacterium]MDP6472819.1 hypothetical protein [Pseudomonadales bacterium]MDP6828035.1 hypothetical protein [Pseudomonadales bacterium]MDP6970565.1 hypothetical protein [Pseudomonadales bacterium]|tara:strand:- start:349 stop:534 length:186 start_codon:yes stop_codon:yes gene_type:complete